MRRRIITTLLPLVGICLGLSACGGGASSIGVAGADSTARTQASSPSTPATDTSSTAKYRAALAYVDCMRSHGVANEPDPAANGDINVQFATGGKGGAPASSGIDRMAPQYVSADRTCRHLLPGGTPTPAQTERALAQAVKFAQCMRSHGVSNYPDPNPADPGVVHLIGIDPNSPQVESAQKACQTLVPGANSK
jgi:hypothetical protein